MVRHSIAHTLEPAATQQLIERAFSHYAERYPSYHPTLEWKDSQHGELCVAIRGFKLRARVELKAGETLVEMDVPLILRPFQGTAVRAIDREANRWLKPEAAT